MFLDTTPMGGPWGEPGGPQCQSCKRPIGHGEPTEELRFDPDPEHRLEELNGTYHADCARPYLSIKSVLDMLGWRPF